MKYILDTNILIGYLKNDSVLVDNFKTLQEINVCIISVGEMLYGAENSINKTQNYNLFLNFLKTCNILLLNESIAMTYAKIRSTLKSIGKPIPENDIWIAATAKAQDYILITRDKHLLEIKSIINIEKW